jgi:hypothetical protein
MKPGDDNRLITWRITTGDAETIGLALLASGTIERRKAIDPAATAKQRARAGELAKHLRRLVVALDAANAAGIDPPPSAGGNRRLHLVTTD